MVDVVRAAVDASASIAGAASSAALVFDISGHNWGSIGVAMCVAGVGAIALAISKRAEDVSYGWWHVAREFTTGVCAGFFVLMLLTPWGVNQDAILGAMVAAGWGGKWVLDNSISLVRRATKQSTK